MKNIKNFLKIIYLNSFILILFSFIGINILEIYLRKEEPFSLFPKELTGKRTLYLKNQKEFIVTDAKKNISSFEPKTNSTYTHNLDGFRSKNTYDQYNLDNSIYTIGDSTSYGLNLNYEDTYTKLLSESLNIKNVNNLSYPGISLNSIIYKLGCLNKTLEVNNLKSNVTVISLYFNDIESLDKLPFLTSKCSKLKDLNLINAFIDPEKVNNIIEKNQQRKYIYLNKIKYIEKYPYYFNQLICKKLYSQSCSLFKFLVSNINPSFKKYIYGNHQSKYLYENMSIENSTKLKMNKKELSKELIRNINNSKYTILFYIPRNEMDLVNTIKNIKNRERIFYLYKDICQELKGRNKNLICLDGSEVIINSLADYEISKLLNEERLPNKYYSYIKMFDMGHPSQYVSNLYRKALKKLID